MPHPFLSSAALVAVAEIGDKTQLLSFFLAARYRKPLPIILGILVATLLNHAMAAYIGHWLGTQWMQSDWLRYGLAASFLAMAAWALVPDTLDEKDACNQHCHKSAFIASCICFFMAEMGDKTQIATVALGVRFDSVFWVVTGTTLGMLLANIPAVLFGDALLKKIPLHYMRYLACSLFATFGVLAVVAM